MRRVLRLYLSVLGTLAFAACNGLPQAPTSMSQPQQTQPAPERPRTFQTTSDALVGSYTLTLSLGSTCNLVPEAERIRKYAASIDNAGSGRYVVTLSDAHFLAGPICTAGAGRFAGIGCHQFAASQDIDTASFFLENNNDEAHGGHVVEQLSSGEWLEIIGGAGGPSQTSGSSITSIDATGTSTVWYCPTRSGYPFPCSASVYCPSTDLRLTFIRK